MIKPTIISFLLGLVLGAFLVATIVEPHGTKLILEIIQTFTITLATVFTAWWTSRTFAQQSRIEEAKEIIEILHKIKDRFHHLKYATMLDELSEHTTKRKQEVIFEINGLKKELELLVNKSVLLRPYTRIKILEMSYFDIKDFDDTKMIKDFTELQHRLIRESTFDIGIQWIKIKRYFGF